MTPHLAAKGGIDVSAVSDARSAVAQRAGSLVRLDLRRLVRIARAVLWLAIDRAADTRSVVRAAPQWTRAVSVTILRASVALLAAWFFVVVWPGTPHAADVDPRPLWAAAPVIVYLLSIGLVIDQFGARYGAAALFGLHVVGVILFLPFMWVIALANPSLDATRFGQSTMVAAAAWPVQFICMILVGYGLASLIPGSLPRQFRFLREARRLIRNVESERPHAPLPLTEARSEASVGAWE